MTRRDDTGLTYLATGGESRRLDAYAMEHLAIPGRVLMELAGQGAAGAVVDRTGGQPGVAVLLCGMGNNGGDGYVVARALADRGWDVHCLSLDQPGLLEGDAAANHQLYEALGGRTTLARDMDAATTRQSFEGASVIIDAVFGTGLSRALSGHAERLVAAANASPDAYRVALDIPSGVCADTGHAYGSTFDAHLTTTFGLAKLGLMQHPGAATAGEVVQIPIGLPSKAVEAIRPRWRSMDAVACSGRLPCQAPTGHKGTFGHVGVVGGASGMGGAAILAARGAFRAGCGLVTWNGLGSSEPIARPAELLYHDATEGLDARSKVLAVGPGLGRTDHAMAALQAALASERPMVLDADALNILADAPPGQWPEQAVLTPHPAEAGRLLGITAAAVQSDRPGALGELVTQTRAVVVLKGARSIVGAPGLPFVALPGDTPTLAVAGSGDVLTGVIAGLMAQGMTMHSASLCGAWLHVTAGKRLAFRAGQRGALASEIADALPSLIAELNQGWFA